MSIAHALADLGALFGDDVAHTPPTSWAHRLEEGEDPTRPQTPTERALAVLWAAAPSLLRRDVSQLGVLGTQRIAPASPTTLGRALLRAQRLSKIECWVYHQPDARLRWFPSDPPSVLVGDDFLRDADALRFRVARAVSLARPAHVIAVVTGDARAVLDGLAAAFGPPGPRPSSEAAGLAGEMWRIVPARAQGSLRELLREGVASYDDVRRLAEERAAELGLLADGGIARSAQALLYDDESLVEATLGTEESYVRAMRASSALRALVRFGFADACLAARGRWLRESG
jgi:hypothetical protein